jgi:hypothetical protein
MIRKVTLIFCFAALAMPALAQQPTLRDSLLDHLVGNWILTGTIAGRQTTHDVSAAWVLNHQYLEFHETSREKNKDGDPAYVATVYIGWYERAKQYVCVWLDDYGGISTQSLGHADRGGETIAFVFQDTGDNGKFHTTFAYNGAENTWTMNMDQETDGKFSAFARTTLKKSK